MTFSVFPLTQQKVSTLGMQHAGGLTRYYVDDIKKAYRKKVTILLTYFKNLISHDLYRQRNITLYVL